MAAFKALDFVFDGRSSKEFGVKIIHIDESGWQKESMGASFKPVMTENMLSTTQGFFGADTSEVLEFSITIGSLKPLERYEVHKIASWLFARRKPCRLYIGQRDLHGIYYECFLTEPEQVSRGNLPYAFTCTVKCTSPFAWKNEYRVAENISDETQISVINDGADTDGFISPVVTIIPEDGITDIQIENSLDKGRIFELDFSDSTTISEIETIRIDCGNKIVKSSKGINRLECFNKKWLRLKHGENILTLRGNGAYSLCYKIPYIAGV